MQPLLSVLLLIIWVVETSSYLQSTRFLGRASWLSAASPLHYKKTTTESELVNVELQRYVEPINGTDISQLIEEMSLQEKYSLLLQSYGNKVLESGGRRKDSNLFQKIEGLYDNMVQKAIQPDDKSTQSLYDAASAFCDIEIMSRAMKLARLGGRARAFGLANGQLTTPLLTEAESRLLQVQLPTDSREEEVFYATSIATAVAAWVGLELGGIFSHDLHLWTNLYSCLLLLVGSLDVIFQKAKTLRLAVAGLERLVLRDEERQAHVDASAFLVGYLLGLPCFCYKPEVNEALKMLQGLPDNLDVYKQVPYRRQQNQRKASGGSGWGLDQMLSQFKSKVPAASPPSTNTSLSQSSSSSPLTEESIPSTRTEVQVTAAESILNNGRVLIWLLTPVAAESQRYGQTILSDPRRSKELLKMVASIDRNRTSSVLPTRSEDQQALLQWAYFEASTLVKQYSDLLGGVSSYLRTGTSTVGECALLIENELS
eukprot:gene2025-2209_t